VPTAEGGISSSVMKAGQRNRQEGSLSWIWRGTSRKIKRLRCRGLDCESDKTGSHSADCAGGVLVLGEIGGAPESGDGAYHVGSVRWGGVEKTRLEPFDFESQ